MGLPSYRLEGALQMLLAGGIISSAFGSDLIDDSCTQTRNLYPCLDMAHIAPETVDIFF